MYIRRARPTLRTLREDLTDDWESPWVLRRLAERDVTALHPVSDLPHPLIRKAAESFGESGSEDTFVGSIQGCKSLRLLEIKSGQWRGGVWIDEDEDVAWLVVGGLAKGGHEDRDDFYEKLRRMDAAGRTTSLLPEEADYALLKRETAAKLLTSWEQSLQQQVLDALQSVASGGTIRFNVDHPNVTRGELAVVNLTIEMVREPGYESDDITVEIAAEEKYRGSELLWSLTTRVLISLHPPEQEWDRFKDTFSNIAEPGTWKRRVEELQRLASAGKLAESVPGQYAHYSHRQHLSDATVNGDAVRALCGRFFVPVQDHESLPCCPECERRLEELPR